MEKDRLDVSASILEKVPTLTPGQLDWVDRVITVFKMPYEYKVHDSDIFTDEILLNFGDAMRIHHSFSAEPFSKDKFEYVLVETLKASGLDARLAPKGNPGHDITIEDCSYSLKTQADKNIKDNQIWVSKFMELGQGDWGEDPNDLRGLLNQFLTHMKSYQRILTLRTLTKWPEWSYELIEIPKSVLELARGGRLQMMSTSRQFPKPGYCYVTKDGASIFDLYFDGGSERKLQIKKLNKSVCRLHATWKFKVSLE